MNWIINWKESYAIDVESGNGLHKKCDCIILLKWGCSYQQIDFRRKYFVLSTSLWKIQMSNGTHIVLLEYTFFQSEKLCKSIEIGCRNSERNRWKNEQTAACNFMTVCRSIATLKCSKMYGMLKQTMPSIYVICLTATCLSHSAPRHTHLHRRQWQREKDWTNWIKPVKIIS